MKRKHSIKFQNRAVGRAFFGEIRHREVWVKQKLWISELLLRT